MTIEDAFQAINNLDVPEGLRRKFAPQHSLIQVDRNGNVVSVERFKITPTEPQQLAALKLQPGCIQLIGVPGMYTNIGELRENIEKSMWLFDVMKRNPEV